MNIPSFKKFESNRKLFKHKGNVLSQREKKSIHTNIQIV